MEHVRSQEQQKSIASWIGITRGHMYADVHFLRDCLGRGCLCRFSGQIDGEWVLRARVEQLLERLCSGLLDEELPAALQGLLAGSAQVRASALAALHAVPCLAAGGLSAMSIMCISYAMESPQHGILTTPLDASMTLHQDISSWGRSTSVTCVPCPFCFTWQFTLKHAPCQAAIDCDSLGGVRLAIAFELLVATVLVLRSPFGDWTMAPRLCLSGTLNSYVGCTNCYANSNLCVGRQLLVCAVRESAVSSRWYYLCCSWPMDCTACKLLHG